MGCRLKDHQTTTTIDGEGVNPETGQTRIGGPASVFYDFPTKPERFTLPEIGFEWGRRAHPSQA